MTCGVSGVQCFKRVYCFQSLTSILLMPQITSSNSRSSNGRNNWFGINSQKPGKVLSFNQSLNWTMRKTYLFEVPKTVAQFHAWIYSLHKVSHTLACCLLLRRFDFHSALIREPSKFQNYCFLRWMLIRWRLWCCFHCQKDFFFQNCGWFCQWNAKLTASTSNFYAAPDQHLQYPIKWLVY